MFTPYKRPDKIIDHSKIDIEEEINKFLKNGGKIQQVDYEPNFKKYTRNNINMKYSEEQNSTELT